MTVRELIERLQGFGEHFGNELQVRIAIEPGCELEVLSIYAVTKEEAKRQGRKKKAAVGLWIDVGVKE